MRLLNLATSISRVYDQYQEPYCFYPRVSFPQSLGIFVIGCFFVCYAWVFRFSRNIITRRDVGIGTLGIVIGAILVSWGSVMWVL